MMGTLALSRTRALALLSPVALLGACGGPSLSPEVAPDGAVHVVYWQSYNTEEKVVFDDLVARFEREYAQRHPDRPPVVIDSQDVPWDNMDQVVSTAAQSHETPDLIRIDYNKILPLAFGRVAVPIEEIESFGEIFPGETVDSLRGQFVGAAYDAGVLWRHDERHLYALPEQITCLALMWNRALFRQRRDAIAAEAADTGLDISHERPPRTWRELEALGRALTFEDGERRHFGFGMRDSMWFAVPLLNVYGVEIIAQDAVGNMSTEFGTDERALAAFRRARSFVAGDGVHDGFEGGAWRQGADPTDRGFENGSYAMVLEGVWRVQRYNDAGLDYGVALVPHLEPDVAEALGIPPEENLGHTNLGGGGLVISRTAQMRGVDDEALEFAAWWISAETQAEWGRRLGQIPINIEGQRMIESEVDNRTRAFLEQARLAHTHPRVPAYPVLDNDIFRLNFSRVLAGDLEPEEALVRIERGLEERILSLLED